MLDWVHYLINERSLCLPWAFKDSNIEEGKGQCLGPKSQRGSKIFLCLIPG